MRERSSWFWMGRPSRSWEEPTCLSTCLMASMVFTRPLYNAASSKKHMYTPLNSNLPIWCCVVWDVRFWCQMKTAFLCLTHHRSFHMGNFLIPSLFFYCAVFGAAGRVLKPLPAAHVKAGYNSGWGSSSSYWLKIPSNAFISNVSAAFARRRRASGHFRRPAWNSFFHCLQTRRSLAKFHGFVPPPDAQPGRWNSPRWLEDQCKGWIPFWLTENSDPCTDSGVISSDEAERASQQHYSAGIYLKEEFHIGDIWSLLMEQRRRAFKFVS